MAASKAGNDHVKDGDDAGDDGLQDGADAVDDGHEAAADGAEDGLNLLQDMSVRHSQDGKEYRRGRTTYTRDDSTHDGSSGSSF